MICRYSCLVQVSSRIIGLNGQCCTAWRLWAGDLHYSTTQMSLVGAAQPGSSLMNPSLFHWIERLVLHCLKLDVRQCCTACDELWKLGEKDALEVWKSTFDSCDLQCCTACKDSVLHSLVPYLRSLRVSGSDLVLTES